MLTPERTSTIAETLDEHEQRDLEQILIRDAEQRIRASRLQILLLLPSVGGIVTLVIVGTSRLQFFDSATLVLRDPNLPAGATANLYWCALLYLPMLATLLFVVTGVQAASIAEGRANRHEHESRTTQMSDERQTKAGGAARGSLSLARPRHGSIAAREASALEKKLRKERAKEERITCAEYLHLLALAGYIATFVAIAGCVHPANPLLSSIDRVRLVYVIGAVTVSVLLAAAVVRSLRVTILNREQTGALAHFRRLLSRSKIVLAIQLCCMMHVALSSLSAPPLLAPFAFNSGKSIHRKEPCVLINSSYVAQFCDPAQAAAQALEAETGVVWLQAGGRTPRCVDGGWHDFVSAYDACHAACTASMVRARAYGAMMISVNVMLHHLFTEMTTGVETLSIDQWVRLSRGGLPARSMAMLFHAMALCCCALFLSFALQTGDGPFALGTSLNNTVVANCGCWVLAGLLLNIDFLCSKTLRRSQFDVFISYRQAADAQTADRLYDKLTAAGLAVWYDRVSLVRGQEWQQGFIDGLTKAAVYVPILSVGALAPMEALEANSAAVDNLLVEMRLALELVNTLEKLGQRFSVCPVFIGPPLEHTSWLYVDNFFAEAAKLSLCAKPVRVVEELVDASLARAFPEQHGKRGAAPLSRPSDDEVRGVAGTLDQIKRYQGVKMLGELSPALDHVTRELVSSVDATRYANTEAVRSAPIELPSIPGVSPHGSRGSMLNLMGRSSCKALVSSSPGPPVASPVPQRSKTSAPAARSPARPALDPSNPRHTLRALEV